METLIGKDVHVVMYMNDSETRKDADQNLIFLAGCNELPGATLALMDDYNRYDEDEVKKNDIFINLTPFQLIRLKHAINCHFDLLEIAKKYES